MDIQIVENQGKDNEKLTSYTSVADAIAYLETILPAKEAMSDESSDVEKA